MSMFLAGLYGLPFALPGTKLSRGLAAKERLLATLMPLLKERHETFRAEVRSTCGCGCEGERGERHEGSDPKPLITKGGPDWVTTYKEGARLVGA